MRTTLFLAACLMPGLLLPTPVLAGDAFPADAFGAKVEVKGDGSVVFTYEFDAPAELRDWIGVLPGEESSTAWTHDGVLTVRSEGRDFSFARLKTVFEGDLEIEAVCRLDPPRHRELLFRLFGPSDDKGYRVALGYMDRGDMSSYVWKFPRELLKKVAKPKLPENEWFDVRIRVQGSSLSVYAEDRLVLSLSDGDFRNGALAFGTYDSRVSFDSIRIEGTVDPAWLASYKPSAAPPVSPTDPGPGPGPAAPAAGEETLLEQLDSGVAETIRLGLKWMETGDWRRALLEFEKAADQDKTAALPRYYVGRARLGLGRAREALDAFRDAASLGGEWAGLFLWRARARLALSTTPETLLEAVEDLRRAIASDGARADAFLELARAYYAKNDLDAAVAAAQKAFRLRQALDAPDDAEEEARFARDRYAWSRDGLPLSRPRRFDCAFGEFKSEVAGNDTQELATWLATLNGGLAMTLGERDLGTGDVILLRSREVFETYRFPGAVVLEGDCATLNTVTGEILILHGPDKNAWLTASAALLARRAAIQNRAPPWIEEGLAAYFAAVPTEGENRLRFAAVDRGLASVVKAAVSGNDHTPLARLATLDREAFDEKAPLHRAQSWTMVHFLFSSRDGDREYLKKVFARLKEGRSPAEAQRGFDWGGVEDAWERYVRSMPG